MSDAGVKGADVKGSMTYAAAQALATPIGGGSPDGPDQPDNPDQGGQTDAEKVAAAKTAIEALTLSVTRVKGTDDTVDGIKSAVKQEIITAAAASGNGVTVEESQIVIAITQQATDPQDASTAGTDGAATATVGLSSGEASEDVTLNITIKAPVFVAEQT